MSGKRQLSILSCFQNNQLPKKVARSEDTVEEAVEETVEEVEEAVEETGENPLETEKRRGLCGAATYRCSFKKEWSTRWPFITMGTTSSFYWCSVCRQENSCAHQGVRDISRHVEGKGHRAKEQPLNSVSSIAQFYVPETSVGGMSVQEAKTRRAEVKVAVAMVQHNVPFAVADHFSPLYKECFRDSPTAQGFKSASTKTTCIINEAVAPHFKKELVMKMRENPFTLVTDGSNDTGLAKMNPLTVRIFDTYKVVHRCQKFNLSQNVEGKWQYLHPCPCHIIHNTAKHAGQRFMEISGFDPEDLTVDVGYWFKGSTNRKGYLAEFCEFHESDYFKSLNEKQPRFRRLVDAISNPLTEVYLLFYQATLPVFTILNLLLQRERSSIFQLHGEMTKFIKKLCARFMKPATLNRLLEAGDITPQEVQLFQQAALAFLVRAVEYGINKLPLKEALLRHTRFVDVQQRTECGVEDALYFIDRFQELLPFHGLEEQDKVCEEFLECQLMDIPMPQDPTTFNVEEFWGSMSSIKCKVTGLCQFGRLTKIAQLVLVLPHSNADAERVFSMVGLNKTKTRNSLALDGTLSSIMTVKMAGLEPNCFRWEPPTPVLKASKTATNTYNKKH
ncbi:N-(5'-phosphoribosyl)anthranilate isomerase [Dissostichus eleginoides]|uniref:N-(5'-phosphoribosyl)anthranilate isomerase n=1 Tax=Dissostichus eleginoides TaxID=100907 RepID=A0AAD9BB90_DISEL|nr:N-(5'-phosphoribosyl)anthranilate isomerase [Dissostichus eleginoides]